MKAVEVKEARLDNGLKIIGEYLPCSQSAALGFFVRSGARDEQPAESGVSHFLEHMMFRVLVVAVPLMSTALWGSLGLRLMPILRKRILFFILQ